MKHLMLAQLLVQHIVNGVQPVLSGMEQPVGHGLPGQLQAHAFTFLLQSVQWRVHHIFLGGNMGNGRRGCKASWQHRGFSGCALHNGYAGFLLTVLAGIGVESIFPHPETGGLHLQGMADLFADFHHLSTEHSANALLR